MRKLETLKIRGVQREEEKKGKKIGFCELKSLFFSSGYFFITTFHFHL
jgi:hypothetical protein